MRKSFNLCLTVVLIFSSISIVTSRIDKIKVEASPILNKNMLFSASTTAAPTDPPFTAKPIVSTTATPTATLSSGDPTNPNETAHAKLVDIVLDKTQMTSSDTINIIAKFSEDTRFIKSVEAAFRPKGFDLSFPIKLIRDGNYFVANINSGVNSQPGTIYLYSVTVEFTNSNEPDIYVQKTNNDIDSNLYLPREQTFTIINDEYENNLPKVIDLKIDKELIENEGKINVTLTADDNKLGIQNIRVYFGNKEISSDYFAELSHSYFDEESQTEITYPENIYKGEIEIKKSNSVPGIFELSEIDITNVADNRIIYNSDPVYIDLPGYKELPLKASFKVINDDYDKTPPDLLYFGIDSSFIEGEPTRNISAYARIIDNWTCVGGSAIMSFMEENSSRNHTVSLGFDYTNQEDMMSVHEFSGNLNIYKDDAPGNFYLDTVMIKDRAGNTRIYKYNPSKEDLDKGVSPFSEKVSFTIDNTVEIAAPDKGINIDLKIDSKAYKLNGKSHENDVPPIIVNNRTMLPLRLISENLGAKVDWDAKTYTVTITKDGKVAKMQIGTPLENDMGTPFISNNRTYVPLRYISEQLGANLIWNKNDRTIKVYITD